MENRAGYVLQLSQQKEVAEIFEKSGVNEYIIKCYGALHTVGEEYLMNDIEEYIAENGFSNNNAQS